MLGWTPQVFWSSSLSEYLSSIEAYNERQEENSNEPSPLTREEFNELSAKHPDKPDNGK